MRQGGRGSEKEAHVCGEKNMSSFGRDVGFN